MSRHLHRHFDAVHRYLARPSPDCFWRWDDSGDVVLWRDLQTIAFREELIAVLEPHAERGLPPLDYVVLLLAATRRSWPEASEQVALWSLFERRWSVEPSGAKLLDKVHDLPELLRENTAVKAELSRLVFETSEARLSPEVSRAVLEELKGGPNAGLLTVRSSGGRTEAVRSAISEAFCSGLARVDAETLWLFWRTGLEELPGPVTEDLLPSARVRALIASLQADVELGGLARVVSRLLGVVHLPPNVSEKQELPLGGISDLTNRGELDRLLLSELAHDDLTLAVRMALSEALYLRRESPEQIVPSDRALLIDSGIRMWGIPRVFAVAVGMALVAAGEQQTPVLSFRSRGSEVVRTDLLTRQGLVRQLEALEPDPHPGAALGPFFEACGSAKQPVDCVVITCEEVLRDEDFQRELAEYSAHSLFVATVSREGHFRLELRAPRRSRVVREAELDLDALFAGRRRKMTPLFERNLSRPIPAILLTKPFPVRLPVEENVILQSWRARPYGHLLLTEDRRLLVRDRRDLGMLQIAEDLPRLDRLYWSTPRPREGKAQAVAGCAATGALTLLTIDLQKATCQVVELLSDEWSVDRTVCEHNGALFIRCGRLVEVFDPRKGQCMGRTTVPMDWQFPLNQSAGTRFARCDRPTGMEWYALSLEGLQVGWDRVTCGSGDRMPHLTALFDWSGHDGPMGIAMNGDLFCTATGEWTRLQPQLGEEVRAREISMGGDRIVFGRPARGAAACFSHLPFRNPLPVVETKSGAVAAVDGFRSMFYGGRTGYFQASRPPRSRRKSLRKDFRAVLIDERGGLALVSWEDELWRIVLDDERDQLHLRPDSAPPSDGEEPFDCQKWRSSGLLRMADREVAPPNRSYRLRVAKWRDGSCAYFDSRGLLHLVSSVQTIPEVTIVLYPSALSGWCSDGRAWGDRYFVEPNESATAIRDEVLRPFARATRC